MNRLILTLMIILVLAGAVVSIPASQKQIQTWIGINYVSLSGISDSERIELTEMLITRRDEIQNVVDAHALIAATPWVEEAYVTWRWPDRLHIEVQRLEPIAYWNTDGFISDKGQVFVSSHLSPGRLPQLFGPSEKEKLIMQQYVQINQVLARTGNSVDTLRLDDREAWTFTSQRGIEVLLGKELVRERLDAVLTVLESLERDGLADRVSAMDVRYANGLAVRWKPYEVASNKSTTQREVKL